MNDDVAFSISQFRDAWGVMCRACPGYVTGGTGNVDYIFSGLPIPFFNAAIVSARNISSDALTAMGREACTWAADKAVPWLFIVTHEALAPGVDASSVLDSAGLTTLLPLTGMRAQRVGPPPSTTNGLQLEVPGNDAGCAAVMDINAAAYGMPLDACKPILGSSSFWASHVPAIGRVDGTPIASAAVLMLDGYRYVLLVATQPDHQRRGYADAVMRHALEVAATRHGEIPTTLHATDAGRPIYARMGYETIATHTAFIEKRFLEGH